MIRLITLLILCCSFNLSVYGAWVDGAHLPFAGVGNSEIERLRQQILSRQGRLQAGIQFAANENADTLMLDRVGFVRLNREGALDSPQPLVWNGQRYSAPANTRFSFDEISGITQPEEYRQLQELLRDWSGRFESYGARAQMDSTVSRLGAAFAREAAAELEEIDAARTVFTVSVIKNGQRLPVAMAVGKIERLPAGKSRLYISNLVANPESLLARDARVAGNTYGNAGSSLMNRMIERFFNRGTIASQSLRHSEIQVQPFSNRMKEILKRYQFRKASC